MTRADSGTTRTIGAGAVLVLLPLLAYARLAHAGFVWDDDTTLTANPLVHAADGLRRIWASAQATDYWPITYSTFWAEWRLWGAWAPGYHLTNVLLHAASGLVLWRLLLRAAIPGAFFAALWFGLHPLNVESVAWIAERKNELSLLGFLVSLRLFASSRAWTDGGFDRWALLSWLAFVASLLSKASTAPLPLVLLGWTAWRRQLRRTDAGWAGLFLATSVAAAILNVVWAHRFGPSSVRMVGWAGRLAEAGAAFWFYLGKMLAPVRLCFVYPGWEVPPVPARWWLGLVAALAASAWLVRRKGGWRTPEGAAWAYAAAMLLPVLGFTDTYFMQYSLVADHYAELALIGVAAWAAYRLAGERWAAAWGWLLAAALGCLTFQRTTIYRDDAALYDSVLARNPACWLAWNNRGLLRMNQPGRLEDAIRDFEAALRLKPDFAEAHNDLGAALMAEPGRRGDAIAHFQAALRILPGYVSAHNNLGNAWLREPGHRPDAIAEYRAAIRLRPDYGPLHFSLAIALLQTPGGIPEAIRELRETLRLQPDHPYARRLLDRVSAYKG